MLTRTLIQALACGVVLTLAACGGGGGGDSSTTGSFSVAITDTPADDGIAVANIQFAGMQVQTAGGELQTFNYDPPRNIDLAALQDGLSEDLLRDVPLPAGRYTWIRLLVNAEENVADSYVMFDSGEEYPLHIPSSDMSGLKLVRTFDLPVNGEADFIIDWDLAMAIQCPPGQMEGDVPLCYLHPALRILDRAESGSIWGTVDEALVYVDDTDAGRCAPDGGNRVYLFEKPADAVTPIDDIDMLADDGRAEVLATAEVRFDLVDLKYRFKFAFVAPGNYTVAFSCSATADEPGTDDYPDIVESLFDFEAETDLTVVDATRTDVHF
jgi:hypothetical protein